MSGDPIHPSRRAFTVALAGLSFGCSGTGAQGRSSRIEWPNHGGIFVNADTFAALRTLPSTDLRDGYTAVVAGARASGDGLGGFLVWNGASTASDDDLTVIAPADATRGRWFKMPIGEVGPIGHGGDIGRSPGKPGPGGRMEIGLFSAASGIPIPIGCDLVRTSGHAAVGIGAADYVGDDVATADLLARFPNLCFRSANGRIFRLVCSVLYTDQAGATGHAGKNDQPAIQQALGYACAVGIRSVACSHAAHEMWCPIRQPGRDGQDPSGVPMTISQNLHFGGLPGGTTFHLRNSRGGPRSTVTQQGAALSYDASADHVWQGGGLYIKPAGAKMEWITLADIHVDGGIPYAPADFGRPSAAERAMLNLTDKGFRIQDSTVDRVSMERCSFRNFAGEIYYIGGAGVLEQDLQDCTFEGSPQCAMNPGSPAAFYFRNVRAGKSYQNEMLGGRGGAMLGCRFYDLYSMFISGGPDGSFRYSYAYPVRRTDISPPFVDLSLSRFERIGTVNMTSWCIGDITTVDTPVALTDTGGMSDFDLRIRAWADRKTQFEAVSISGPDSAKTQVSGAPVGVAVAPPRQGRVEITCHRTALAVQNNRVIRSALRIYGGLIDQSCQFIIDGDPYSFYECFKQTADFTYPRIDIKDTARPLNDFGSEYGAEPKADFTLNIAPGVISIGPAPGIFTMSATLNHKLASGQRVRFINKAPGGHAIRIPARPGAGISLSGDRVLNGFGSYLELEQMDGKGLVERGFSTQGSPAAKAS